VKKERIVGLCICVVLLVSLQSLIFYAAGIRQLRVPAFSRAGITVRSSILPAVVYAGWPHLGFLYGELQLLHERMAGFRTQRPALQAGKSQDGHKAPNQLAHRSKLDQHREDVPKLQPR